MGQGLYRCLGWGCLNPPAIDFDELPTDFVDVLRSANETEQDYVMIPMAVDDPFLQESWGLPDLPKGLPYVQSNEVVRVECCEWWPDVGKRGVWVPGRIVSCWELLRRLAKIEGFELPEGHPIFVCDWD